MQSGKNWRRLKALSFFQFWNQPWTLICVPGWRGATLLGLRCHTTKRIKASEATFGVSPTNSLWAKPARTADEYRSPRLLAKENERPSRARVQIFFVAGKDEFFPEYVVRFSVLCHCLTIHNGNRGLLGLIKAHCLPICSVGALYLAVRFNRSRLVLVIASDSPLIAS